MRASPNGWASGATDFAVVTPEPAITDVLPDGILVVDSSQLVTYWNPAAEALLTIDGGVPGTSLDRVRSRLGSSAAQLLDLAGPADITTTMDAGTPLRIQRFRRSLPTGTVFILRDVTPVWLEQEQRDEFLSFASHELKTPLTNVKAFAQLANRSVRQAIEGTKPLSLDRLRQSLDTINAQADRLTRLLDSLLDVSRVQTRRLLLARMPLDLGLIVQAAVNDLRVSVPGTILLAVAPDQPVVCDIDPVRIRQVVDTILRYSLTLAGPDATVLAGVENGVTGTFWVRYPSDGSDGPVLDQLITRGIPANRRADSSQDDLGLGLFVARGIVDLHCGTLSAQHSLEETTITLTLPKEADRSDG